MKSGGLYDFFPNMDLAERLFVAHPDMDLAARLFVPGFNGGEARGEPETDVYFFAEEEIYEEEW